MTPSMRRMKRFMNRVQGFKGFLQDVQVEKSVEPIDVTEVKIKSIINSGTGEDQTEQVAVQFDNVDQIIVENITDSKGRLSDSLDAISQITGFRTLPLSVTKIPPEIAALKRHQIYELCGVKYAMSLQVREEKINQYCTAIVENLQAGVPFKTSLFKSFEYCGTMYNSLDLTEGEWTILLSKFRAYKQRLYILNDRDLILEVYPESSQ